MRVWRMRKATTFDFTETDRLSLSAIPKQSGPRIQH
jgi:hypothetical protein